jgi:ADP-heptose:LPS heptosyltransferase
MRALRRLARYVFFYAADALVKTFDRSTTSAPQLLLVRLDAIGDFVIWLDAAKAFRSLYPSEHIVLCVNSAVYELAKALPHWDEVVEVDVKRFGDSFRYRFKLLLQLRRRGFDTVIQPTFSRVFLHGDAIIRATGAKHRVGSAGDVTNLHPILKRISDTWYTKLVPAAPGAMMELERNAEFTRYLRGQVFDAQLPILPKLEDLPKALKVQSPYFVVFPGASWSGRQWPVSKFSQVAATLYEAKGWVPVLCGGPGDRLTCQRVIDQSGVAMAINLGGLTNLAELAELLRSAKLLISNETSAVHIAVAVSTPSVCVLGGGHYGRFMPYPADIDRGNSEVAIHQMSCYNCNWHCTQPHVAGGPVPCIANVTVKSVLERIEAVLSRVQNQSSARSENLTR